MLDRKTVLWLIVGMVYATIVFVAMLWWLYGDFDTLMREFL